MMTQFRANARGPRNGLQPELREDNYCLYDAESSAHRNQHTLNKRQSNRPDRRLVPVTDLSTQALNTINRHASYAGSAFHKTKPADYRFVPPTNPRPSKSVCDDRRIISAKEAGSLLRKGVACGMVSRFAPGSLPKYVWAVDADGEVYEAKTQPAEESIYHGYRLGEDEQAMREYILKAWKERCTKPWK